MTSIKVAVRCRPLLDGEKPATGLEIQGRRILLDTKTYDPDCTFTSTATQDDVFELCRPTLQCVKDGLHGTIMVYGQTGTGKTYTMFGVDGQDNGIVHKVIAEMLEHVQQRSSDGDEEEGVPALRDAQTTEMPESAWAPHMSPVTNTSNNSNTNSSTNLATEIMQPSSHNSSSNEDNDNDNGNAHLGDKSYGSHRTRYCTLALSMMELYNEKLTDMLSEGGDAEVSLIAGFPRFTHKVMLCRMSDATAALRTALTLRRTAATAMNDRSSRSHLVLLLDLEELNVFTGVAEVTHLFLVDLAGSESLKKSQASGLVASETGKINRSLLALKSVLLALAHTNEATRPSHIPYRDSKLTELLQDSLGGSARTLMIACISSVGRDVEETKSTLMYAVKARSIRNAANTEKEKLLIRLRSTELENQRLRNRLQQQVCERGGYYVSRDDHEEQMRVAEAAARWQADVESLTKRLESREVSAHVAQTQRMQLEQQLAALSAELEQWKEAAGHAVRRGRRERAVMCAVVRRLTRKTVRCANRLAQESHRRLGEWRESLWTALGERETSRGGGGTGRGGDIHARQREMGGADMSREPHAYTTVRRDTHDASQYISNNNNDNNNMDDDNQRSNNSRSDYREYANSLMHNHSRTQARVTMNVDGDSQARGMCAHDAVHPHGAVSMWTTGVMSPVDSSIKKENEDSQRGALPIAQSGETTVCADETRCMTQTPPPASCESLLRTHTDEANLHKQSNNDKDDNMNEEEDGVWRGSQFDRSPDTNNGYTSNRENDPCVTAALHSSLQSHHRPAARVRPPSGSPLISAALTLRSSSANNTTTAATTTSSSNTTNKDKEMEGSSPKRNNKSSSSTISISPLRRLRATVWGSQSRLSSPPTARRRGGERVSSLPPVREEGTGAHAATVSTSRAARRGGRSRTPTPTPPPCMSATTDTSEHIQAHPIVHGANTDGVSHAYTNHTMNITDGMDDDDDANNNNNNHHHNNSNDNVKEEEPVINRDTSRRYASTSPLCLAGHDEEGAVHPVAQLAARDTLPHTALHLSHKAAPSPHSEYRIHTSAHTPNKPAASRSVCTDGLTTTNGRCMNMTDIVAHYDAVCEQAVQDINASMAELMQGVQVMCLDYRDALVLQQRSRRAGVQTACRRVLAAVSEACAGLQHGEAADEQAMRRLHRDMTAAMQRQVAAVTMEGALTHSRRPATTASPSVPWGADSVEPHTTERTRADGHEASHHTNTRSTHDDGNNYNSACSPHADAYRASAWATLANTGDEAAPHDDEGECCRVVAPVRNARHDGLDRPHETDSVASRRASARPFQHAMRRVCVSLLHSMEPRMPPAEASPALRARLAELNRRCREWRQRAETTEEGRGVGDDARVTQGSREGGDAEASPSSSASSSSRASPTRSGESDDETDSWMAEAAVPIPNTPHAAHTARTESTGACTWPSVKVEGTNAPAAVEVSRTSDARMAERRGAGGTHMSGKNTVSKALSAGVGTYSSSSTPRSSEWATRGGASATTAKTAASAWLVSNAATVRRTTPRGSTREGRATEGVSETHATALSHRWSRLSAPTGGARMTATTTAATATATTAARATLKRTRSAGLSSVRDSQSGSGHSDGQGSVTSQNSARRAGLGGGAGAEDYRTTNNNTPRWQ